MRLSVGAEQLPAGGEVMHTLKSDPDRLGPGRIVAFAIDVAPQLSTTSKALNGRYNVPRLPAFVTPLQGLRLVGPRSPGALPRQ